MSVSVPILTCAAVLLESSSVSEEVSSELADSRKSAEMLEATGAGESAVLTFDTEADAMLVLLLESASLGLRTLGRSPCTAILK